MRGSHVPEARLHEWVEGLLPEEAADRVRSHVAACAACAREAESIRSLRVALGALPAAIDPGVDLRPGIRREIARSGARPRPPRSRPALAAAAVLVLATTAVVALVARPGDDVAPVSPATATAEGSPGPDATFRALDLEYGRAAAELRRAVEGGADRLGAPTARLVRDELAVVERALAESRSALEAHPESPTVRQLVLAAHRQRLDVLRRAAALAAES